VETLDFALSTDIQVTWGRVCSYMYRDPSSGLQIVLWQHNQCKLLLLSALKTANLTQEPTSSSTHWWHHHHHHPEAWQFNPHSSVPTECHAMGGAPNIPYEAQTYLPCDYHMCWHFKQSSERLHIQIGQWCAKGNSIVVLGVAQGNPCNQDTWTYASMGLLSKCLW
jgi:hypothetical protein